MIERDRQGASAANRWHLPVPDEVADDLLAAQFDSLSAQVPILLAVAALNTLILIATCWHSGMPFAHYGWMSLLVVYCFVRQRYLLRRFARAHSPAAKHRMLLTTSRAALVMLFSLGVVAGATYASGLFAYSLLIPMSLGFGSISIAHCLYRIRGVAVGAIALGIGPSALTLIAVGDFDAKMLGISMISVGLLMMRFVSAQYAQLIDNLLLQQRIRSMANSDPLTGVANRRGVAALLDGRTDLGGVGLALIDLDDFKQVNDVHGHDVGDALLKIVAQRLAENLTGPGLIGRLGGDEFVAVMLDVADEAALSADATRLLVSLCHPAQIGELSIPIGASIGHALGRQNGDNVAGLTKRADQALYAAKNARKPSPQARSATIARSAG